KEAEGDTIIASSDISLSVDAPQTTTSGNQIEYIVNYENKGKNAKTNLQVRVNYPDGFSFSKAEPSPSNGNRTWDIPSLKSGERKKIKVLGALSGGDGESKRVEAEIGTVDSNGKFFTQIKKEDSTRIVEAGILITETVNGKSETFVDAGTTLDYVIEYKNEGGIGLRNVVVENEINTEILDMSTFNAKGGALENGKIVWNSSGVSELALIQPSQEGRLEFSAGVKKKEELPISSISDKNFQITSRASISSDDIAVSISAEKKVEAAPSIVKLNTFIGVDAQAFYYDQFTGEPLGNGPMPPKVGQKTTYKVFLNMTNLSNDVAEVVVKCQLAPGIKWEWNDSVSHGEKLDHNSKTGEVLWKVGRVPANTGTFSEKMIASFDISITPGEDRIGKTAPLIVTTKIVGEDTFTEQKLDSSDGDVSTELPDDKFAEGKGNVEK
ncbi:MAG: hypothetical protein ACD_63C00249G0006, partial [uncultured bacterium]